MGRAVSALLGLLLWAACGRALALGPHEVLLLVNEASPDSVAIAAKYARVRGVPASNLVMLRLPEAAWSGASEIRPEEFTRLIWEPACAAAAERGLTHVLAWIYSVDLPVSVTTPERMSVQGVTFVRNRLPEPEAVKKGAYASPLFAGPGRPGEPPHRSQSFDVSREWLGVDMPLPSMALGYVGEGGMTPHEVMRCLERGAASDATYPTGTVYFVTNSDIRSSCRQWQFPAAVKELAALGCAAEIRASFPAGRPDVLGLMAGAPWVNPWQGMGYVPGAMGEHLTSMAAIFHLKDQTKLTAWLQAGAAASAGTVTEPYAIWTKFPAAQFYVHYAGGCTMLESFSQSIRCPLQILLVGDPLACPWGRRARLRLDGLGTGEVSGTVRVSAAVNALPGEHFGRFVYLVDGRLAGEGRGLSLDTRKLSAGTHAVRCVAYRTGLVRDQVYDEQRITVKP